ncbi:MAG: type II CAAX endopeptidase family protein [Halolamina sp.]|uniref:CPBP family intramembrane glutamic endopeptidase n=1 Tax=Halolamina sp. TaxID=1940283 RepID=UPI002FC37D82
MRSRLRAIGVGIGVGVLGMLVSLVLLLATGLTLSTAGVEIGPVVSIGLTLFLTQGLSFMGVGYLYLRRREISLASIGVRLPSLRGLGVAVGALLLSMIYLMAASQVIQYFGAETAENNVVQMGMENPEILLLLIPGAYLFIGPGEELLFRGVVQNRIREVFPPVSGVVVASIIFVAIHLPALSFGAPLSAKLTSLVVLMGPSLILGGIYEYTDNLVVPILVHGSYDALLFIALYAQATTDMGGGAVLF